MAPINAARIEKFEKKVDGYYPKYQNYSALGKTLPLTDRIFRRKTILGCAMREKCEKELASQKNALAANKEILDKQLFLNAGQNIIMKFIPDLIDVVSIPDGTVLMASDSYLFKMGYDMGDIVGTSTFGTIHPDDMENALSIFKRGLETGEGMGEVRVRKKDGSYIWMEVKGNIVRGKDGKPSCAILVSRDIDEVMRLSGDLRNSEEKFRGMFKSMNEMAAFHEIIYGEDGRAEDYRYLDVNTAFTAMTGISRDEAIGSSAKGLFGTGTAPYLKEYAKVASTGAPLEFETYFEPIGKHLVISAFSLRKGQFVTITSDITGRKEAEKGLEEALASAREANLQKNRFLSIVAHDLRSPFNNILGFGELALEEAAKSQVSKEELQTYLTYLTNSAKNTFGYLENLLTLSRIYVGSSVPKPETFDIASIATGQQEMNKFDAMKKGIVIKVKNPHCPVFADKEMITTVLHNLVRNSIKFTLNGTIAISFAREGKLVRVTVADTGVGMPPQILDNLFKLDINTSRKGTNNEPGTGLGVILVKEYVEKNGGTVRVESEEGKGTAFSFTLPGA